jgi:hypothetical protein
MNISVMNGTLFTALKKKVFREFTFASVERND